jgi:trehalose 6-phosphate phosphatase
MKNALEYFGEINERLSMGCPPLLLFDYDGTLTPIVDRPKDAILSPDVLEILTALSKKARVGFFSGRSLKEIKRLVGLSGALYCGSHGLEAEGFTPPISPGSLSNYTSVLGDAGKALSESLRSFEGAYIEDKPYSIVVHYRLVGAGDVEGLRREFSSCVLPYLEQGFEVRENKMNLELAPKTGVDKGVAVKALIKQLNGGFPVLYVGDDATDEDAFNILSSSDVGIHVGAGPSCAKYFLADTGEVKKFLKMLADILYT